MWWPTWTTTIEETSDPTDCVPKRQSDGKIVRASPIVEPTPPREYGAGCKGTQQATEKDKAGSEVRPEMKLTCGVVMPSENNKEAFGANNCAEKR
jgi:hypothetical protein